MNVIEFFIEICCFSDTKNEVLLKYLSLDKKNANKQLIRLKLSKNKTYLFENKTKKNSKPKIKNFYSLCRDICDDSIIRFNITDINTFIKTDNPNLILERFCLMYQYNLEITLDNLENINFNFKNNKYLFEGIKNFEKINFSFENSNLEYSKMKLNLEKLQKSNKELEIKAKELTKENTKLNKLSKKLEDDYIENLNKSKKLTKQNEDLMKKIGELEKSLKEIKNKYKNSIVIDEMLFSDFNKKYIMIHTSNLNIVDKIHPDIEFIKFDVENDIDLFLSKLNYQYIEKVFVESKYIKSSTLNQINIFCKNKNIEYRRMLFSLEKELNEKLSKLK